MNPQNTVFDAKRLIGRKFNDPTIQHDISHWPFTVVPGVGDKPMIQVEYKNETKTFSPEEISSMVLIKMRDIAQAYVGVEKNVQKAVSFDKFYFSVFCLVLGVKNPFQQKQQHCLFLLFISLDQTTIKKLIFLPFFLTFFSPNKQTGRHRPRLLQRLSASSHQRCWCHCRSRSDAYH